MKKTFFTLVVSIVTVVGLCSFDYQSRTENSNYESTHKDCAHVHATGRRCNGTVGCGCPGFAPITNGKVWEQAYCKHCGHNRSYHK